jgi:hypothetical protein
MEYMFLIHSEPAESKQLTPEEMRRAIDVHWAIMDDAAARGVLRGASPLMPARSAVTVRRENGVVVATDGPYAETRELLGGYYLIDCRDADEARYWAERLTEASRGLVIEYRALAAIPARAVPTAHV